MDEEDTRKMVDEQAIGFDKWVLNTQGLLDEGPVFGVVGIMLLNNYEYLCVIKNITEAGKVTRAAADGSK